MHSTKSRNIAGSRKFLGAIALTVPSFFPQQASAVIWNATDPNFSAINAGGLTDRYGQFSNSTGVFMTGYGGAGTTTYLKDGWFLTALHVLSAGRGYGDLQSPNNTRVNINGQNYYGSEYVTFGNADIAMFRVSGWQGGQLTALPGIERRQLAGPGNGLAQIGGEGRDGPFGGPNGYSGQFHRAFNVVSLINGTIYTNANAQPRLVNNGYLLGIQGPGDSGSGMFEGNGPSDQTLDLYDWSLTGVCQTGGGDTLGNAGGGYAFINNWAGTIRNIVYPHAVLSWNANASSTATATDGSGVWNTSTANFTDGTNYSFNGPERTEQAIFGSGNGAAGTVTLTSTVPITEVVFNAAGSGNYTIAGNAGTSLFARANTRFTTNVDATISANITGGGANGLRGFNSFTSFAKLTKNGNATLTLTGNSTLASDAAFYARAGTTVIAQNGTFAPGFYTNVAAYQGETATLTLKDNAAYNAAGQDFNLADLGGNGTLNVQNSATVTVGQLYVGKGWTRTVNDSSQPYSAGGTGTVNQTGGTVTIGNVLSLGSNNAASQGTYNLSGGTLVAGRITRGTGTGRFNFNGGTLRPIASTADLMSGLTSATVQAGGAKFDTNSFSAAIAQPLVGGAGDGGVTKNGLGTLTLAGGNNYQGATVVNAGTLAFTTLPSIVRAVTVADGATLRTKSVATGSTLTSTSLTLGSTGVATLAFDLTQANAASPFIATGAFAVNGSAEAAFSGGGTLDSGTYKLVGYTSVSGAFATTVYSIGPRSMGTLVDNGTGALNLSVVADRPIWTGADNGSWSTNASGVNGNWRLQSTAARTDYLQGDNVLFDDTATGSTAISVAASGLAPAAMTFNNSTKNYTVSSTSGQGIGGEGILVKNGSGTVTLSTSNSYSGGTFINGGVLSVSNDNNLGASGVAVSLNGGTLRTTAGINSSRSISIGPSGGTINVNTTGQYYLSSINALTGSGALNVTGSGTLTAGTGNLRADQRNTYSGAVTLSAGGNFEYGISGAVAPTATFNIGNQGELIVQSGSTTTFPNAITVTGGTNSVLSFVNGTSGTVTGPVTLNANLTVALRDWYNYATNRSGTISGTIDGNGGLTVNSGTGTGGALTLTAANTFAGNVVVNGGTVNAANGTNSGSVRTNGPLGSAAAAGRTVTINNGGKVAFTVGNVLVGSSAGNSTAPALSIIVNQGGTLATAAGPIGSPGSGDANVFGNITLNGGTFTTGNGFSRNFQAAIMLGTFTFGGTTSSTINTNASNNSSNGIMIGAATPGTKTLTLDVHDVTNNSATDLTISAPLTNSLDLVAAGAVTKTGAGTMELSGRSTFTGNVTVNGGTVLAGYGENSSGNGGREYSAFGNVQTVGKTVTINNGSRVVFTAGNVLGGSSDGNTTTPNLTFVVNNGSTLATAAGGGGDANVFGNIILNGGTFVTGNGFSDQYQAAILRGSVTVGGTAASTINTNATNTVSNGVQLSTAGSTFNVAATGATGTPDLTVSARLADAPSGSASLIKSGAGVMRMTAANSYTGGTTVTGGTLTAKYSSVASAATPLITGVGTDLKAGRIVFDYTGSSTPAAAIRSLLVASYEAATTPGVMDTGTLRNTLASNTTGLGYKDDAAGSVTVMATLFGDADLDGGVSINDVNALSANFGQSTGKVWTDGDFDYDGGVSINDFNLLAGGFGQSLRTSSETWAGLLAFAASHNDLVAFEAVTGVPEPTGVTLLSVAGASMLRRRRRKSANL